MARVGRGGGGLSGHKAKKFRRQQRVLLLQAHLICRASPAGGGRRDAENNGARRMYLADGRVPTVVECTRKGAGDRYHTCLNESFQMP